MDKSRLLGALGVCVFACVTHTAHTAPVPGQGTWETTLQARDLDSNPATVEAWYNATLNITWLANANLAASNSFGLNYGADLGTYTGDSSGYHGYIYSNGTMNLPGAMLWIDAMNTANYLGYNGWRLPTVNDVNNDGATYTTIYQGVDYGYNIDTANGEMAHMFYDTLGNTAYYNTSGVATGCAAPNYCLTNTGDFINLQSSNYWSATEYAPNTDSAWDFGFDGGYQLALLKSNGFYRWAVHSGDVGAAIVPLPAAVWLFGGGLLGLIGVGRRRR